MAQSIWEKIGMAPQLQPEVFGPKYAMNAPLNNQTVGLAPTPLEEKDMVTPQTLQSLVKRAPQSLPEEPLEPPASPTLSPLQEMIKERLGGMKGMQAQIDDIQNQGEGFKNLNLQPFLAFGDQIGHTNFSRSYQAPVAQAEKVQKLKEALGKEKSGLTDDLLQLQSQEDANERFKFDQDYKEKLLGLQREQMANALKIAGIKAAAKGQKPPSSSQWQAAQYGRRMQDADKIIRDLSGAGVDLTSATAQAEQSNWSPNAIRDPNIRRAVQAQINYVNAILRRQSGAAIADSEFVNEFRRSFPLHGDDPETLAQKDASRARDIQGLMLESGDAWKAFDQDPRQALAEFEGNKQAASGIAPQEGSYERYQELLKKAGRM